MATREMKLKSGFVDPLRYKGFVPYTTIGTGATAAASTYEETTSGNGLGLIMSASLDSGQYVDNNMRHYGELIQANFELMALTMFLNNSSVRTNTTQKIIGNKELLIMETHDVTTPNSSISRQLKAKKRAIDALRRTFDSELSDHSLKIMKTTP